MILSGTNLHQKVSFLALSDKLRDINELKLILTSVYDQIICLVQHLDVNSRFTTFEANLQVTIVENVLKPLADLDTSLLLALLTALSSLLNVIFDLDNQPISQAESLLLESTKLLQRASNRTGQVGLKHFRMKFECVQSKDVETKRSLSLIHI